MIIGKRTASVITAFIGLAVLALPVAADTGDIDQSAPAQTRTVNIVEDNLNPSTTSVMTVSLFANDDSNAPAQTRLIEIVEDSNDSNGTVVMQVPTWDGTEALQQDASAPTQTRLVSIVEDGFDASQTVAMSIPFDGEIDSQPQERYVTIVEDVENPEGSTAVINLSSSDPVYALLLQPDNVEDAA